jgi:N-methylhydantoinase A/oxoprolinase/acetone carboxylase beta subunit
MFSHLRHSLSSKSDPSEALVLGIDTGGTYTDGVLLEYHSRKILAAHKSLTTKRDFSIGIENVIKGIDIQDASAIRMVSVSTTLATNAIAEGKGKRVALFLIGYDSELVASFKMESRFSTPNFFYFTGGHNLQGQEKDELDLPALVTKTNQIKGEVDAIAISSYFSPLNPEHEIRAYKAISQICDLPLVLGHQLSTKLGSVERATTAALNASLLAVLQDFIIAVRRAMERRGIEAPLMVVRGDGTLMSDEFAARSPVETIHSGPAASAIGGRFLSRTDDALVVDVGGTTTDLALIQKGEVTISENGASVAGYKTSVNAANLLSIGLGGDSHITLNRENNIVIGPERVVPLAYLAQQYPKIRSRLKALTQKTWPAPSTKWLEYWFLLREPRNAQMLKSNQEKELVKLLREGPKAIPELLEELGLFHLNQLGAEQLVRQEIIGKAGLTPTDLLHVDGRYKLWDSETSQYALKILSNYLNWETPGLTDFIWSQTIEMIVKAIVEFLSEKKVLPQKSYSGDFGSWVFHNSLYQEHSHLDTQIRLRCPIIGIGAPAEIMLAEVAKRLHTDLILPDHYFVANAVGAVAGSVMVAEEILVYPHLSPSGLDVIGYYVQARDKREEYDELEEALKCAHQLSKERAMSAALRSGADNPQLIVEETSDGLDTYRIRAQAVGNPRLAK